MRRLFSLLGIVVLLVLAFALLWRVWVHHNAADPYEHAEPAVVQLWTVDSQGS